MDLNSASARKTVVECQISTASWSVEYQLHLARLLSIDYREDPISGSVEYNIANNATAEREDICGLS